MGKKIALFLSVFAVSYCSHGVTIIGGGIIGLFEAYQSYLEAKEKGITLPITILEKNKSLVETTAYNLVPSLTPDEILAVVPRGTDLMQFLGQKFNEGKGIRVDDVEGLNFSSEAVQHFFQAVQKNEENSEDFAARTHALLNLGKRSMHLWNTFYQTADEELKSILRSANFKPCLEVQSNETSLCNGYRVDLIFDDAEAHKKAMQMQATYNGIGYESTKILSPDEVVAMDPSLESFVDSLSVNKEWKENAIALWRPGGSINAAIFLPKFVAYLEKRGGVRILYDHKVVGVQLNEENEITRLKVRNSGGEEHFFPERGATHAQEFIFAPGESTGTLEKLGFDEPSYANFAGPSLCLTIPLSRSKATQYKDLDHCMEVHQEGVVLSWQAKCTDSSIYIGIAGTKAFYGDKKPRLDEEFAKDRHLFQLNTINRIFPELVSLALKRKTRGEKLVESDLQILTKKGLARVWVGTRGVAYDGFPTLGRMYIKGNPIPNGRVTTHLGSGGVSCALGAVEVSRLCNQACDTLPFAKEVLVYSDTKR